MTTGLLKKNLRPFDIQRAARTPIAVAPSQTPNAFTATNPIFPQSIPAAPAAAPAEAKTYKVGVAIYQFDDNFMTLYRNELQDYFKSLETDTVKYDVTVVDGKNDMAEQNNQIDNFITQGMDAIILNLRAKRWEPRGFSRVAAAFSSYDGDLSLPLGLALGSLIFMGRNCQRCSLF